MKRNRIAVRVLAICLSCAVAFQSGALAETHKAPAESKGDSAGTIRKPATPQPLSQNEAEELSRRSEHPGDEVAGGALSNQHLTYIVIALAAAVVVLIAK